MKLWICEKSSQAKDLAKVLKVTQSSKGYIRTQDGTITWAIGHLMEELNPVAYGPPYDKWNLNSLPIIPKEWKMGIKPDRQTQFQIIMGLIAKATEIVIATDPDAEGERIAVNLIKHAKYTGKLNRLWSNDITETGIKRAINKIKDASHTDGYYQASLARSRADWLVGMNYTKLLTLLGQTELDTPGKTEVLKIGRVKTPTLWLVVNREREIANFKPENYYELNGALNCNNEPKNISLKYTPKTEGKIFKKEEAQEIIKKIQGIDANLKVEKTNKSTKPPALYSLNSLQKDCGNKFGWSADKTLKMAQTLYETHKLTSYPRTDCTYLPEDQKGDVPQILDHLYTLEPFVEAKSIVGTPTLRSTVFNTKKVTAHYAIIPTSEKADLSKLNADEKNAYLLIACRYIQSMGPEYKYENTTVSLEPEKGYIFKKAGNIPTEFGWKKITPSGIVTSVESEEDDNKNLPPLEHGIISNLNPIEIATKVTKPLAYYTEMSLLDDMENVGKYVKNPTYKKLLKENTQENIQAGIGTSATRATILKELKQSYLTQTGKKLRPKPIGTKLIEMTEKYFPQLPRPEETAIWEIDIAKMRNNEIKAEILLDKISEKVINDINTIKNNEEIAKKITPKPGKKLEINSPKNGEPIEEFEKYWKIPGIGIVAKVLAGCTMTLEDYIKCITTGQIGPFEFQGKQNKFKAKLKFTEKNIGKKGKNPFEFNFDTDTRTEIEQLCPITNKPILEGKTSWKIESLGIVVKSLAGATIPLNDYISLAKTKKPIGPYTFTSKANKPFEAYLTFNEKTKKLEFTRDNGESTETEFICPKSNKPILEKSNSYQFPAYPEVQFQKVIAGRTMNVQEYIDLLNNTGEKLEGFISKAKKPFSAKLKFDIKAPYPVGFDFGNSGGKKKTTKRKVSKKRAKK